MDPLDRLSQELVRAAQQTGALHRPIAIREIVTTLVPYRVVRPLRIAELLDDYRQLVLRLIAGERELVEADAEVRAAARAALASRHPDLSVLERYGDHLVTVASASPAASPTPVTPATPATNEMTVASGTSADSVASDAPAACRYCTRALPAGYTHRFCPWCGHHLLRRCQSCRASLEATWTFCVTCGHPA